jgi:hypothetical protein
LQLLHEVKGLFQVVTDYRSTPAAAAAVATIGAAYACESVLLKQQHLLLRLVLLLLPLLGWCLRPQQ